MNCSEVTSLYFRTRAKLIEIITYPDQTFSYEPNSSQTFNAKYNANECIRYVLGNMKNFMTSPNRLTTTITTTGLQVANYYATRAPRRSNHFFFVFSSYKTITKILIYRFYLPNERHNVKTICF